MARRRMRDYSEANNAGDMAARGRVGMKGRGGKRGRKRGRGRGRY